MVLLLGPLLVGLIATPPSTARAPEELDVLMVVTRERPIGGALDPLTLCTSALTGARAARAFMLGSVPLGRLSTVPPSSALAPPLDKAPGFAGVFGTEIAVFFGAGGEELEMFEDGVLIFGSVSDDLVGGVVARPGVGVACGWDAETFGTGVLIFGWAIDGLLVAATGTCGVPTLGFTDTRGTLTCA
jgi:hypothetical protein